MNRRKLVFAAAVTAALMTGITTLADAADAGYPADVDQESGFRLPLPQRADLDSASQAAYDQMGRPDNGSPVGLRGPGGLLLYSPELSQHYAALNHYLRVGTGFSGHVRELAILVAAREADCQFEWTAHEPLARKEGVPPATIDAVKYRKGLDGIDPSDAIIIALGRAVFEDKKVDGRLYARALHQFGPRGLIDLVALMGNYVSTAALLATFDMQLKPGTSPLLPAP